MWNNLIPRNISGLPFYDVLLLSDLPKSASLPVATVQQSKARIMDGRWDFDYLYFTESDQVNKEGLEIKKTCTVVTTMIDVRVLCSLFQSANDNGWIINGLICSHQWLDHIYVPLSLDCMSIFNAILSILLKSSFHFYLFFISAFF